MLQREKDLQIDSVRRVDYAKLINDSGHHLLSVVQRHSTTCRNRQWRVPDSARAVRYRGVVANCCALFELKAAERAESPSSRTLRPVFPTSMPTNARSKQILINLLSNAIKFTNPGGEIAVRIRRAGPLLSVAVQDNGIGVGRKICRGSANRFQARASYDRKHDGTGSRPVHCARPCANCMAGAMVVASTLERGHLYYRSRCRWIARSLVLRTCNPAALSSHPARSGHNAIYNNNANFRRQERRPGRREDPVPKNNT